MKKEFTVYRYTDKDKEMVDTVEDIFNRGVESDLVLDWKNNIPMTVYKYYGDNIIDDVKLDVKSKEAIYATLIFHLSEKPYVDISYPREDYYKEILIEVIEAIGKKAAFHEKNKKILANMKSYSDDVSYEIVDLGGIYETSWEN